MVTFEDIMEGRDIGPKYNCYDISFDTGYGYECNDDLIRVRDNKKPRDWDDSECRLVDDKEYEYFKLLYRFCGLIEDNCKYKDKDWGLTEDGVELMPIAIIYDKVDNRLCASVDIFDTFNNDGQLSWQVKNYRDAFEEIKEVCKLYGLYGSGIKLALKLDKDGNIKENEEYDDENMYDVKNYTNRVLRLWIDIDLNKLSDVQYGGISLLGSIKHFSGELESTFDSRSTLWIKE